MAYGAVHSAGAPRSRETPHRARIERIPTVDTADLEFVAELAAPPPRPAPTRVSREWLVQGVIPAGRLASIYGPPGIGKSTFVMQLAAAVMYGGCPVIPRDPKSKHKHPLTLEVPEERRGRVLWLTWEDETDEFVRRWNAAYEAGAFAFAKNAPRFPDPKLLTLVQMRRLGGIWGPAVGDHRATVAEWTPAGSVVVKMLQGHTLAISDPIASAYAASEIDRAAVRAFASALDIAGEDAGCATLLIGHPAKATTATGGRYSGSSDWDAAPRARMEMDMRTANGEPPAGKKPPPTGCAVTITKISYGPRHKEPLWLRNQVNPGFALVEGGPPEADAFAEEPERGSPEDLAQEVI